MSRQTQQRPNDPKNPNPCPSPLTWNYPKPLTPPPSAGLSKQVEVNRAMSASSKSTLFSLSPTDVLFHDDWLIAVNKPPGVYCESVLASIPPLLLHSGSDHNQQLELHLANRLDRDTSGVMVITKSHKAAAKLVRAFTQHKVAKTYIALCVGSCPKWGRIVIKSGHGRSKFGAWRVYAASDAGRSLPGGSIVKEMETLFEVLSVDGNANYRKPSHSQPREDEGKLVAVEERAIMDVAEKKHEILVRASPQSGRTHQIRLHCQYLGIPIRGDVKYEGVYEWKGKIYDGHELHAENLSLEHPVTGLPLALSAPLPLWASQALQAT